PNDRNLAYCQQLVDDCYASTDYKEGRTAFMEKRKPEFRGG
ncbi:MAG TPA: enoyl-CoA hydratase, partial [Gammaproteobacteria bacterium]